MQQMRKEDRKDFFRENQGNLCKRKAGLQRMPEENEITPL